MPFAIPTLKRVREMTRDEIVASLSGASVVGNNVLRILSDGMSGLAHHVLRYLYRATQDFLPDTASFEWLNRHGDIWLVNADATTGRKAPAAAVGTVTFEGTPGVVVPTGTQLQAGNIFFQLLDDVTLGAVPTEGPVRAVDPESGTAGNLLADTALSLTVAIPGVSGQARVVELGGGTDEETDSQLRGRVLFRIREPPMGGDANDYVAWTLAVAGVTRAWAEPLAMGMGTVTVRFMMDDLRSSNDGFPLAADIDVVTAYLDTVRPVAVKDRFIVAPIPEPIDFTIDHLVPDNTSVRAAIENSVKQMLLDRAAPAYAVNGITQPAQTIYAAWVSEAVLQTAEVQSFKLIMDDHPMPHNGALAVLGVITYS